MKKKFLVWLMVAVLVLAMPLASIAEGDLGVVVIGGSQTDTSGGGSYAADATELKPDSSIKVAGDYRISFNDSTIFSDDYIHDGYSYKYMKTKENGAEEVRYDWSIGTHTPAKVTIDFTNMSKENVYPLKRVTCQIVFDNEYVFETMPVQYNPNQTTSEGKTGRGSLEGAAVEPLMKVTLGFFYSVPFYVRDSAKPLDAYITIDGTDTYVVHLRDVMTVY